jgi:hypothetical protein
MAELVAKLSEALASRPARASAGGKREGVAGPNRDRLTAGVDLGDQWSNYCILGLEGETLAEGQLRTTQQDFAEFFRAMAADGSGDALGVGAGSGSGLRARSAGSQPTPDGRTEAAQAQE